MELVDRAAVSKKLDNQVSIPSISDKRSDSNNYSKQKRVKDSVVECSPKSQQFCLAEVLTKVIERIGFSAILSACICVWYAIGERYNKTGCDTIRKQCDCKR